MYYGLAQLEEVKCGSFIEIQQSYKLFVSLKKKIHTYSLSKLDIDSKHLIFYFQQFYKINLFWSGMPQSIHHYMHSLFSKYLKAHHNIGVVD